MRYFKILILIIIGLLQFNYGLAADLVEIDGLKYEYIKYNGPVTGYGEVYLIGYSSSVPEDLKIPYTITYKNQGTKRQCYVSTITSGAFSGCTKIKSVHTPQIRDIKNNAFAGCTSLQVVSFGSLCRNIGSKAFTHCTALNTVYYTNTVIAEDAFDESTYQNAKLIVSDANREQCNNDKVWSKFQNKIYTYSISVNSSFGSVNFNGTTVENESKTFSALEGSSVTLSFTPEEGRELANLIIDGEDVTSKVVNNQYMIDNVSKSMDIQVSFFSIKITAKGNGHVLCKKGSVYQNPSTTGFEQGDTRNGTNLYFVPLPTTYTSLSFFVYPDEGYQLAKVIRDGVDITSQVYIYNNLLGDEIKYSTSYEFTFEEIPPVMYSLSIKSTGNGIVSYNGTSIRGGEKSFSIEEGNSPVISFASDAGHQIKSVKLNGTDVTSKVSDNKFTINNISADTSMEVEFEPILHTLTISSSGFGEASYNGVSIHDKTQTFSVVEGTSPTITFTPEAGYRIASVKLDGTDVTASVINNTYTIRNISADMTLSVTFEAIPTYTLSVISSGNGSAYFNNTTIRNKTEVFTINGETDATITFTPDDGYRIASVKLNGTDVTSSVVNNQYTISKISANTTISVTFEAITHTLSVTASGNGSAIYNNTTIRGGTETFTVNEGASATVTFVPDAGYKIANVKVNGTDVTSSVVSNKYTISSISANTTLAVTFEAMPITTYTFSISATGNGSVVYNGTTIRGKSSSFTVNEGTTATITLSPDTGYRIASVKVNNTDVTASVSNNTYTVSSISANTTIAVTFEAVTHTLSISASGNGSATYNSTAIRGKTQTFTVNEGTSATITFAPDAGYRIANVKVNGTDVTTSVANNKYTISNITADVTLSVMFEAITHTLSITASGNGSATYNSTAIRGKTQTFTVNEGSSATVTFTPDAGYRIASVMVNGTDVTSSVVSNKYTINNITADVSLAVTFEAITHTLSITASGNGSATYNNTAIRDKTQTFTVNEGTSATITFAPDAGYRIASVKVNGADVTSSVVNNKYTISNITANTTLSVTFEAITHTLTITASGNGSATYNSTAIRGKTQTFTVNEGSSATVIFTPDTGYKIGSVKVNGTDVTSSVVNNKYTISNITENTTLSVSFTAITHTLSITASGNGSATYNSTVVRGKTQSFTVNEGTSAVITITPDTNYKLKSVKLNGTDITSSVVNGQYTISNIKSDNALEVVFEGITHTLTITATGNGSATYNSTAVRGKTQTFTVNQGASATVTFTPDAGYRIASMKVNGTDVTSKVISNKYTISNITADVTLAVTFEAVTHTLSITASGNGSATYNSTAIRGKTQTFTVNEGTSATVTFTPDAGYRIASVKVNGTDVTTSVVNNKYTISNITADVTLAVTFEVITHTLSITASGNGSAAYNSTTIRGKTQTFTVNEGSSATVTFTPDAGYKIGSVKVNGTDVTASVVNNKYTISNITEDTTLSVSFTAITHTLSITASGNGSVTYNGTVVRGKTQSFTVNEGTSAVVTITPDTNFKLKSVKLNGTDITSSVVNGQYTISNIKSDNALEVVFEGITHTLTITATGNGSATFNETSVRGKSSSFTVNEGSSAIVEFTPDANYQIKSVKLNGTDITSSVSNSQYTISNIKGDNTLEVEFEPIINTLSITATGNGAVTYNGTTIRGGADTFSIMQGSAVIISFAADSHYQLKSVKQNGTDVTSSVKENQYTIDAISGDTSIEIEFEAIMHTLSISSTGNGVVSYSNNDIRSGTKTFKVMDGSSATIAMTADVDNRLKRVMLNGQDVTSDISDGQLTLSNITGNNALEVEFEPMPTYELNITASGNGSLYYGGKTIRNQSREFIVKEGSVVAITVTPDNGYRVGNIMMNGEDMTAQLAGSQLSVTVTKETNVEVTFEAVPIVTFTQTVKATGNGTVSYNGTDIRNTSREISIAEGTYATFVFTPDAGSIVKSVILNGEDITSSITNNQYTISKVIGSNVLEVEFIEVVSDLAFDGVNYRVVSQDEQTVMMTGGSFGLTLTVPATFEAEGKTWKVTGVAEDALSSANELAAIIWEPEVAFTAEVSNPNLLLYVKKAEYAPSTIQNVVVGNQAESIVLKEATEGNNFYCPREFTAKRISYEHNYSMISGYKTCQGWETLVLPFDVSMMISAKGTELVPYADWQQGSSLRPFWIYQLTESGWQARNAIKANVPYIISMPNNEQYDASYNLAGYIEFVGTNVQVMASDNMMTGRYGNKRFVANYQNQAASSDIYALNVSNEWCQNTDTEKEGSTFIRSLRNVHPFEAYMTVEGSAAGQRAIPIFMDEATKIREKGTVNSEKFATATDGWYDLQGRKLQGEPTREGIYIYNGRKVKK